MIRQLMALAGVLSIPCAALAQEDPFGLGDGHLGALTVQSADTIINAYASVTIGVQSGTSVIPVSDTMLFKAKDLVMLWQTVGLPQVPASGDPGPFQLSGQRVGRFELARVVSADLGVVRLSAPIDGNYDAFSTQIVRVPEYTDVSILPQASVVAREWDGLTGGLVAFLANGSVEIGGEIKVDGAGFRGGVYVNDTSTGMNTLNCTGLDVASARGASKGEGLCAGCMWPAASGRGNRANGGGGGNCHNSGGGGGGHAGIGGQGGRTSMNDNDRLEGGLGGGVVEYAARQRLILGGGGGAGHGNQIGAAHGGRGGGAVFLRARRLSGTGRVTANGLNGASTFVPDGAAGGGAGGVIHIRCAGALSVGAIEARGGDGGNANFERHGPGGGGGGGRVLLQGAGAENISVALSGGTAGVCLPSPDGGYYLYGPSNSAEPSASSAMAAPFAGIRELLAGMFEPPAVDTTGPETVIEVGPPPLTASTDATFQLGSDESGVSFQCKLDGQTVFNPCEATVRYSGLAAGVHAFEASAMDAAGNADLTPARYEWKIDPSAGQRPGCGCASSESIFFGVLGLMLLSGRRSARMPKRRRPR